MEGVDYRNFDIVVGKMRKFFSEVKGFREVHTQNKKSILAACEDPRTIATYNYEGQIGHFLRQDRCGSNIIY